MLLASGLGLRTERGVGSWGEPVALPVGGLVHMHMSPFALVVAELIALLLPVASAWHMPRSRCALYCV